ncbi:hypothetical protein GTA08_BOTSDO01543 [Botryosphaeria dothidea]|uniref:Uncharacterized protein n=1 Tax=Botryosphaeria dothidea TaxID=55169 RepID=A0A8H4J6F3_9PEZI|nr:hypothetical protein GTA08_BOTSDO01543 [Botryosphaeria dothidea]
MNTGNHPSDMNPTIKFSRLCNALSSEVGWPDVSLENASDESIKRTAETDWPGTGQDPVPVDRVKRSEAGEGSGVDNECLGEARGKLKRSISDADLADDQARELYPMAELKNDLSRVRSELREIRQDMDSHRAWLEEVTRWIESVHSVIVERYSQQSPQGTCEEPGCTCEYEDAAQRMETVAQ